MRLFHWIWTNQATLYRKSRIFLDKVNLYINYSGALTGKHAGMHPSLPVITGCVIVCVNMHVNRTQGCVLGALHAELSVLGPYCHHHGNIVCIYQL